MVREDVAAETPENWTATFAGALTVFEMSGSWSSTGLARLFVKRDGAETCSETTETCQ